VLPLVSKFPHRVEIVEFVWINFLVFYGPFEKSLSSLRWGWGTCPPAPPLATLLSLRYSCISDFTDFQFSADSTKLVLGSGDICLHCCMKNLFKKQSAKFVQNSSSFTKVMAQHILVFFMPHSVVVSKLFVIIFYRK